MIRRFSSSALQTLPGILLTLSATPTFAWMPPMNELGPQSRAFKPAGYAHVIHVSPDGKFQTVGGALAAIDRASGDSRYAILVSAGTYHESNIRMKPHIDLYGGFAAGDWTKRDVYQNATTLDGQKQGPVVVAADHARLDGFVITGGVRNARGAGILCDRASATIVNNIIVGNHTTRGEIGANEGAGIAILSGSRAYVSNNLICDNTTASGAGAGMMVRGDVHAKILRNVFCNNTGGLKDDETIRGSSGAAIAVADGSDPQITYNVMVLGEALSRCDAGGIYIEGNSTPLINYNWIVGNTAHDDGGAIYAMGNSYYDEANVVHDVSPDGPAVVEDNFIAGNGSVHGAPGGVRVSRMGRVDLRRNRIVANLKGGIHGHYGGVFPVMENNTIKDNDGGDPSFRLSGDISTRSFDPLRHVTTFTTSADLGQQDLSGGVVRIGKQWSVIKSSGPKKLEVWGKITDGAAKLEILDPYSEAEQKFRGPTK
jgi:hypothetical protein